MMNFFEEGALCKNNYPVVLGDPSMTLLTDPRMDPRVTSLLAAAGDL